jgi:AraC-like DNA-binding protein
VRDKAEKVRAFVKKEFGFKTVIGIGRPVKVGEVLYESYREAVLALHLCVQTNQPLLVYGEQKEEKNRTPFIGLYSAATDLAEACEKGIDKETQLARDRYVREVLEFTSGNVELVRGQFLTMIFRILEQSKHQMGFNPGDAENYANYCCNSLMRIDSIQGLLSAFKDLSTQITHLVRDPSRGSAEVRMEGVLTYLRANFGQELKLSQVAQKAGFSVPVFCRYFKQMTGMTFVAYLNHYRVERAKALLRDSDLSLLRVGQVCGFPNAHRFIRNFKQVTGKTPGDFR